MFVLPTTETWLLFLGTSAILTLAPGPDIIFTLTQSITNGRKAGIQTALGLASGNIVHTTLVAFGIAALLKQSAIIFWIIKIFGAGYLLWLSYLSFRHRNDFVKLSSSPFQKKNLYAKGFLMIVLNPKVSLCFLAYLPGFISAERGNVTFQIYVLGTTFIIQVALIFGTIGFFGGSFGNFFKSQKNFSKIMNILSSIIFSLLAAFLLFT